MTPLVAGMIMLNALALTGTACILYSLYQSARAAPRPQPNPMPQPNPYPPQTNHLQNGGPGSDSYSEPGGEGIPDSSNLVQFLLYAPQYGKNHPYLLHLNNHSSFLNSPFNINQKVKVIIHGFLSNANADFVQVLRDAYLREEDVNVICVDWSGLSSIDYIRAMNAAHTTSYSVAKLATWLMKEGVKPNDIHFVGHSLGAHVSGMAGHRVAKPKIGRITGLDPAGPGFHDMPMEYRLDPEDAMLVDVIHTHMNVLAMDQPLGHIDFYPNGGQSQPGCPDPNENIWNLGGSVLCNHGRAFWLFAESINNKKAFKSFKCASIGEAHTSKCSQESNVYMGQANSYEPGIYFMKTAGKQPFSLS